MTYQELKKQKEEDYNNILGACGVFWAFSKDQFKEGIEKSRREGFLNEGEKVARIPLGGFCPVKNIAKLTQGIKEANEKHRQGLKELRKEKQETQKAILYELNNHECFYTGDVEPVVEIFKNVYTKKQIVEVFKKFNK